MAAAVGAASETGAAPDVAAAVAAAAAKGPERVMTVDDCSRGRFLGVRMPPEAAPLLLTLVVLAGVEAVAFVEEGAIVGIIAPRPRAGVIFAATADFCLGVASFWPPESRAERLVVRPDAAFSALGSAAVEAARKRFESGEEIRRNRERRRFAVSIFDTPPSFSSTSFSPFFFLDDDVVASPATARFRACFLFWFWGVGFEKVAHLREHCSRSRKQDDGSREKKRLRLSTRCRVLSCMRATARLTLKVACSGGCMFWALKKEPETERLKEREKI